MTSKKRKTGKRPAREKQGLFVIRADKVRVINEGSDTERTPNWLKIIGERGRCIQRNKFIFID